MNVFKVTISIQRLEGYDKEKFIKRVIDSFEEVSYKVICTEYIEKADKIEPLLVGMKAIDLDKATFYVEMGNGFIYQVALGGLPIDVISCEELHYKNHGIKPEIVDVQL